MAVEASTAATDLRPGTQGRFARPGHLRPAEARLYALSSAISGADRETLAPQLHATVDDEEAQAILDDLFGPERPPGARMRSEPRAELGSRLLGVILIVIAVGVALVIRSTGDATRRHTPSRATIAGARGRAPVPASFAVRAAPNGLIMHNVEEGLSARFSRGGASIEVGGLTWPASLRAIGYGRRLTRVSTVTPTGAGNRVVFARGPVSEWYLNGPRGLEQGFIIARPPALRRTGRLTLAIGLPPSVEVVMPKVAPRSATILRGGRRLFSYDSLSAVDARGRSLPVRIRVTGNFLLIRVKDRGASYPIRIDPWFQRG